MTGDRLMLGLIALYLLTAGTFAYEHNWPKMTYWLGAAIITSSVVWMK